MKSTQGEIGRVFILRLEDGDILPQCIEEFALSNSISVGHVIMIGGVGEGEVVVGPRKSYGQILDTMVVPVDNVHEIIAIGIIAPDEEGSPVLHIHGALGRAGNTITGCLRQGVSTWLVGEVIIYEILETDAKRVHDEKTSLKLLTIANN